MTQNIISINQKFGKLRLKEAIQVSSGSHKRVVWICDCGKEVLQEVRYVTKGRSKDCRKCNILSTDHMTCTKFGSLKMVNPKECLPASEKIVKWACDCGREADIIICNVISGRNKTCGSCTLLSKEYVSKTKFGKLMMIDPIAIKPKSNKKVRFLCDCGKETITTFRLVYSGKTSSCGRCNAISSSYFITKKFGKLKLKNPIEIHSNSDKKLVWVCDCGQETSPYTHNVLKGLTKSCGKCVEAVREWLDVNRALIDSLIFPINPHDFPSGGITPLEPIQGRTIPFLASCFVCQSEFRPKLCRILDRPQLTCGCSTNRISHSVREIGDFISSIGFKIRFEEKIGCHKYDIFVPDKNLVIEFNGLHWHSISGSKERDLKKWKQIKNCGYDYISIFEDEWRASKSKVSELIRNRLTKGNPKSIRPSKCEIIRLESREINSFYDTHHYLGKCRGKVHYGVKFDGQIIAATSFGNPTRQSKHPWELLRMASDSKFRVHGIWSKILKIFIQEHAPSSIVSFSENRLFHGSVYKHMGFQFDGEIPPDYYWVKGNKRFHKSGLRKRDGEKNSGKTEAELRTAEGYRRVWDLGKKRWVLRNGIVI